MRHSFDTELAEKYGIAEAVVLSNIAYWVHHNAINNRNYHDGYYWTYNSRNALSKFFRYLSEKQLRRITQKLIDEGLILSGNYNEAKYDRTLWYTLTEKGAAEVNEKELDEFYPKKEMDLPKWAEETPNPLPKWANESDQMGKPIPNSKPNAKLLKQMENNIYEQTPKKAKSRKKDDDKTLYLEDVRLTDDEYQKLIELYGSEELVKEGIEELNNYKMGNGKKYDSDYFTMRRWVYKKIKQEHKAKPQQTNNVSGNKYEAMEEAASKKLEEWGVPIDW